MIQMILNLIKTWWVYSKLGMKGAYFFLRYRILYYWYCIFTPKDADSVEDIPRLNKASDDLTAWGTYATMTLMTSGFNKK